MVKKTLSGDKTAFNQLVAKYQTRVYGLAVNLSRSFSDAEDLAQEAFLRAYLSLHQLREPAKFGNWLYKITQNVCWRWLEKKTNHEEMTERIRMNGMEKHILAPDELAEAKELKERVRNAIDALPEQERLFVTLYYMDGLTQHDIADFVGVSESTVKRRLRSSKKKLKGELLIMVQDNLQKHDLTSEFTDKVVFKIENLESAVRDKIEKPEGPILKSDLEGLTRLGAREKSITDLYGIEHCTKLEGLWLGDNQILDLSPLSNLTNLQVLSLVTNQISDLSPLSNLTNLQSLWLANAIGGGNQISDITPLSGLTNLRSLALHRNQVSDLSPLSNLTKLQTLHLSRNQISDLSPLSGLTDLRIVILHRNQIKDIKPLANKIFMQILYLDNNQIQDISPLEGMPYIGEWGKVPGWGEIDIHLSLSYNQISDITPLVNNSGIGEGDAVDLRGNPLNAEAICVHIPALQEKGVNVLFDPNP